MNLFDASAYPQANDMPCPNEPPEFSTPGNSKYLGCPKSGEFIFLKVLRSFLLKNLSKNTDNRFYFKCNLEVLLKKLCEVEKAINCVKYFKNKVLFIKGANSDYINDEDFVIAKKMFPNSKLKSIENAGHWVHAENPIIFLEKTLIFLKN